MNCEAALVVSVASLIGCAFCMVVTIRACREAERHYAEMAELMEEQADG